MRLENPLAILYILWLAPLLAVFFIFILYRKKRLSLDFASGAMWHELLSHFNIKGRYIKLALIIVAVIFIIIAMARPQLGFKWEEVKQKGVDIIFAVDVSRSMLSDDIKPNRLMRAKLAIKDLVVSISGDRLGLVAFSGTAFLMCPLTNDYDGFLLSLDDIGPDSMPRQGTSLSAAIKEAIGAYDPAEKRYRVLILISDGEDHEGEVIDTAREAEKQEVSIFTIGAASEYGSLIPLEDKDVNPSYLVDGRGYKVQSRLNEPLLKEIAFITNGAYLRSTTSDFGLKDLYKTKIAPMERRQLGDKRQKRYFEHFQIPLTLAIILLFIEPFVSERKR